MKTVFELTDAEIDSCLDGATTTALIRQVLQDSGVVQNLGLNGWAFANSFALTLAQCVDVNSAAEFAEHYHNNLQWGLDIAHSLSVCCGAETG